MRKAITLLIILLSLILVSCQWWGGGEEEPIDDKDEVTDDVTVITDSSEATIEFYDRVDMDMTSSMRQHKDYYEKKMPSWYDDVDGYIEDQLEYSQFWKAGTFTSGKYEGRTLVVAEAMCDGPCLANHYRFAVDLDNDEWTLLAPYSVNSGENLVLYPFDTDEGIYIEQLEAPEKLDIYEHDVTFLFMAIAAEAQNIEGEEVAANNGVFTSVKLHNDCIYGVYPDGLAARYMLVPEPFGDANTEDANFSQAELTFTDIDGNETTDTYSLGSGKCGFFGSCTTMVEPNIEEKSNLELAGYFGDTEAWRLAYIAEDSDSEIWAEVNEAYSSYKAKEGYYQDETVDVMSLEEFLAGANLFFVKMETGEYSTVFDADYSPVAECGKPVIYLYPEEETEVNVQVGIDEFTITDPVYGEDGWNVIAEPDGTLTNLADGKEYPYLFWEGNSDKTIPLEATFTLSKKGVIKQLPDVLQDLGLNETETSDFMEFWEPRLLAEQGKYIEFSFAPKELFDQIAPLTITPEPDQVIRVFMVYQGLDEPGLAVPNFNTPKRHGFTVVEWGGDLH